MKKSKYFILLLLQCTMVFADPIKTFCPDPAEIKNNSLYPWLPIYKENEELASDNDMKKFKEHIQKFAIARWDVKYLETAHCFYTGDDPIVDKIILAADAWRPLVSTNWNWLSDKIAECRTLEERGCGFMR